MDLHQIEKLIQDASTGYGSVKVQATQLIDQLRMNPMRDTIGLQLFYQGNQDISKLFGLTLLRDYLRYFTGQESQAERLTIREGILNWVRETFKVSSRVEPYVMNNIASVLTLCIKCDFPENWASAFEDVVGLSELGWMGIDLCTRILADLDAEVIVFSESRAQEEIAHNRAIKDAMREGTILFQIVNFLINSARQTIEKEEFLSVGELCLTTLAAMIGWIDISLIVNETILPQIYQFVQYGPLSSAACGCLLEIAKKGMDPSEKVRLVASIGLINVLSELPFNPTTCEEETIEDDIGTVIDVIFVELISCWIEFENYVLSADMQSIENSPTESEIRRLHEQMGAIGQTTGEQLKLSIPVLMKVFSHAESVVSATVLSALKKLVAHIKKQQPSGVLTDQLVSEPIAILRNAFPDWFFIAADSIPQLLSGIYLQLQFPVRFYESSLEADEDDEEIAAEVEAKSQMRQLFVSCCRICPTSCLQLIGSVLSSLPQPLYQAPFPALEAALRLVYSFGESGTQYQTLVNEGIFPSIIEALHQSEIHRHRHPMVLIAYYDVATRYASQSPIATIQRVVEALVSPQGLRNCDGQLKCRSAFFIKKLAETLQNDSALLLQSVGSFADLIVTHTDAPPLPEQAEMHLLEAIGLMTSARSQPAGTTPVPYTNEAVGLQLGLLQDLLTSLVAQLQSLLEDPLRVSRYGEQLSEIAAWKFGSLGSLTKGHTPRSHGGEVANMFYSSLVALLPVICEFAKYKPSRSKSIIYLHRMVQCIGYRVLDSCSKCLPVFIEYADTADLDVPVQLLNQLLAEFGPTEHSNLVIEIANDLLIPVVDRLGAMYGELRQRSVETDQTPLESGQNAETSLEAEKLGVLKNYLLFLQHITTYRCDVVFLSSVNAHRFPDLLNSIVSGIRGGEDDGIRISLGLSLRRATLLCLTPLIPAWLAPSSSVISEAKSLLTESICNDVLPTAFRSFSNGSLNVSDPQAQAYIGDTATLIWTMMSVLPQETRNYLVSVLFPSLGWHSTAINELTRLLNDVGQVNTFRESFKKLIRKFSR